MTTPPSSAFPSISKITKHSWWILLLIALCVHWFAAERRIDRVEHLSAIPTWSVEKPDRDPDTITGYENNQRHLLVTGHHGPSYYWIREAQESAAKGKWRVRHIDYDAPPDGRETSRTSLYRWWLITVAWFMNLFQGESLGYGIESASLYADPLLLLALLLFGTLYTARFVGPFAAIGFTLGGLLLFPLSANFQPGAPDSHSLSWLLAVGSILPLLAGIRKPSEKAYRHFAVAGLFAGLGLWNDAVTQAPVLLAILASGLAYEFLLCKSGSQQDWTSNPWRYWSIVGAGCTFAGWLFEYAPDNLSISIASISPIHAIAFLGFGELLQAAQRFRLEGKSGFSRPQITTLFLGLLAASAWPITGFATDSASLLASDFYARQLANHPAGGLGSSLAVWLEKADTASQIATLLPGAVLIAGLVLLLIGKLDTRQRATLLFTLVPAFIAIILAFLQLRWWNLFDALLLVLLATLFAHAQQGGRSRMLQTLALSCLLLPGLFVGFPSSSSERITDNLSPLEIQSLIERDFSYWLNKRNGENEVVLFSTPLFSTGSSYYGGFNTVASSDKENEIGYNAAVRIASANTEQEISILIEDRGITHIALPLWDATLEQLVRIGTGTPQGEELPPNAFVIALRDWDVPNWMRPLNYSVSNDKSFANFQLRPFSIAAEQSPELALSRLADLFVERGMLWEAKSIRGALLAYPRNIYALGAIANIDFATKDQASLKDSLDNLIPYLSRRSARNLPTDRRISLAGLFMRTDHTDLAKDQIIAAIDDLDEETLRELSPTAITILLALSQSLNYPFPQEELKSQAFELVSPGIKSRLTNS